MERDLLTQMDFVLSKCGRPKPPAGRTVVYVKKGFLLQQVLAVGTGLTFQKEVTGDTTWVLRSIQCAVISGQALYWQVQLPNGHFISNALGDINQIAGYGSNRYVLPQELECPPGSKIQITLDDTLSGAVAAQPISVLFDGAYKYYLPRRGDLRKCSDVNASHLPRYDGDGNGNVMAPMWMYGEGPNTPEGATDTPFVYSSQQVGLPVTVGPFSGTAGIQIDPDTDFVCWRLLFDVEADEGVTSGTFMVRARAGSGYALMDDYFDAALYVGSSYFVKAWEVAAGDTIYFDHQLVDYAGTGNMFITCYAEGVKRRGTSARVVQVPPALGKVEKPAVVMPQRLEFTR